MQRVTKQRIIKAFWEQTPYATVGEIVRRFKDRYVGQGLTVRYALDQFPFAMPYGNKDKAYRRNQAVLLVERHPEVSTAAELAGLPGHEISRPIIKGVLDDLKRTGVYDASQARPPAAKPEPVQMDIEDVIRESTEAEPLRVEEQLVMDRGKHYGHPLDNFQDIHAAKTVIAKCEDVAVRHALEMIWLKITRLVETPDHQDSINDIKGYAETINMIHAERKRRGIE